jgi:hypothetical protein
MDETEEGAGPSGPTEKSTYEVGYGKPPRHSRFKPGRSGNPKGRPKGAMGCKAIVERVLLTPHMVVEQGKPQQRTGLELVLLALRNRAMEGDGKAFWLFHELMERYGPRDAKLDGAFIFMRLGSLSPEEQEEERQRVQQVEQQRQDGWEPKGR